MAVSTGDLFRYVPPKGLGVPRPRPLDADGVAAERLRDRLGELGINATTTVTDIGDETIRNHQVKLIGWMALVGDAAGQQVLVPMVTSVCMQLFVENFRRVA